MGDRPTGHGLIMDALFLGLSVALFLLPVGLAVASDRLGSER